MRYFLRHITRMRIPTALLLSVCALAMWVADYIRLPEAWTSLLATQILVCVNAGLLSAVAYRAKATHYVSLLPALLYILAVGIFPYLRMHWPAQLMATLLLYYLYATREMPDTYEPNGLTFFLTVLLCLLGFLVPDALWCIPLLWVVVLLHGSFTIRTILASLMAIALFAIYYEFALYRGWLDMVEPSVLINRHWFSHNLPVCMTTAIGIMMGAFLLVTGSAFSRSSYDLVSTRMLLYHSAIWGVLSVLLCLFLPAQPDCWALLPMSLAVTTSIFLLQKESEARGITLLIYIVGALALYFWLLFSL